MFCKQQRKNNRRRPVIEQLESRRLLSSVSLDFTGSASGLADSGFTSVLHSSNGGAFIPSDVSVNGGQLRVVSTAGDFYSTLNNQDNALDVGLDASQDFVVQTRITSFRFRRSSQSAGIFVGTNQDNYVKFVVGDLRHTGLQLASEVGGSFTATNVPAMNLSSLQTLDLELVGDPATHTLTAEYRINSSSDSAWVTYGQITNRKVFKATADAGIVTTNDGTKKHVTVGFASFSAQNQTAQDASSAAPPASSPALTAGTNVDAMPLTLNQASAQVAVNPTNPQNMVIVAQNVENQSSVPVSYSFNGGATWTRNYITGSTDGLPYSNPRVDARVAFDKFGNLYVVYEVAAHSNEIRMVVARSSNGGVNFTGTTTAIGGAGSNVDYPSIATGPDVTNPAHQAIWVTYTDYANPTLRVKAVAATSSGLGQLSAFSAPLLVSSSTQGDLANVAVGPKGQVAVTYESEDTETGPDRIFVSVDANGTRGTFGSDILATHTNVGPYTPIPAQPDRTIDAVPQVAFDTSNDSTNGRLYLVYTDAAAVGSSNTNIELRYSDNLGASFSSALQVNDDKTSNSQFLPAIAVDPTTGNVGISWLDARNSRNNNTAQEYATISTTHGVSVLPNVLVSAGTSNQAGVPVSNDDWNFGDVTGAAFSSGNLIAAWADNSNSTGNNPNGTDSSFDIDMSVIKLT